MLPAYAGMILGFNLFEHFTARAPRVCGDDPGFYQSLITLPVCSPRMRG